MATSKIAIDIAVNTLQSSQSLKELKDNLKGLEDKLFELEEGSAEFNKLSAAIGEAKKGLKDLNEAKELQTLDGKFKAFADLGAKIGAGFELASSTMALFGQDTEEIEKALKKAQAAMMFVQGIKELEGLGGALKNAGIAIKGFAQGGIAALRSLWVAMLANPITAILVGLTALGGAIAFIVTREKDDTAALRENIAERERQIESLKKQKKAVEDLQQFETNLEKARGETIEESRKREDRQYKERISQIDQLQEANFKALKDQAELARQLSGDEATEANKKYQELLKQDSDYYDEKNKLIQEAAVRAEQRRTDDAKKEADDLKERQAKYKDYLKKKEEDEKAHNEKIKADLERNRTEELKNLENQRKAKELDGTLTYEDRKKYLDDVYALEIQKAGLMAEDLEELRLKHLENLKNLDAEEQKRKEEQAAKDKELADKKLADEIAAEEEYDEYIKDIEAKRLARKTAIKEAELNLVTDTLKLTADIATAFAKEDEASQRKAFEINKKMQLALATIEMIKGVQSAFTSAQGSPFTAVFPGYPYVQAAMAAAYGLMNIRKISQTQFEGGGGAAGGMESAAGGAGGAMSAPLQGGVNNTSTMLENLGQQQEQKPIKAYVLQTDVASEDQKIKAIENKSKIE